MLAVLWQTNHTMIPIASYLLMCMTLYNPLPQSMSGTWDFLITNKIWQRWCNVTLSRLNNVPILQFRSQRMSLHVWSDKKIIKKSTWLETTVASRTWRWPPANSQQDSGALIHVFTRKWILSTTWINLEVHSSSAVSPDGNTVGLATWVQADPLQNTDLPMPRFIWSTETMR